MTTVLRLACPTRSPPIILTLEPYCVCEVVYSPLVVFQSPLIVKSLLKSLDHQS